MHRGFPGKFESSNVSRDNVCREIGRISAATRIRKHTTSLRRSIADNICCIMNMYVFCVSCVVVGLLYVLIIADDISTRTIPAKISKGSDLSGCPG